MRNGYPVTADGKDKYMPNVKRLKLPLTFLAGEKNRIFLTETSRRTYEWLKEHNGDKYYQRIEFEGYAHMDFFVGKNARTHGIFNYIREALEKPPEESKSDRYTASGKVVADLDAEALVTRYGLQNG